MADHDDPQLSSRKSTQKRTSRRYSKDGDYKIMAFLVPSEEVPKGSLKQWEGSPDFPSAAKAKAWIRENMAEMQGARLSIVKVCSLITVAAPEVPSVVLRERPKEFTSEGEEV